jgi:hypothetical protein
VAKGARDHLILHHFRFHIVGFPSINQYSPNSNDRGKPLAAKTAIWDEEPQLILVIRFRGRENTAWTFERGSQNEVIAN